LILDFLQEHFVGQLKALKTLKRLVDAFAFHFGWVVVPNALVHLFLSHLEAIGKSDRCHFAFLVLRLN